MLNVTALTHAYVLVGQLVAMAVGVGLMAVIAILE
jgi:hypothetical protein